VVLLDPTGHVGGMMSNGLSFTDIGDATTLGGYTKEFFDRVQAIEGTASGRFHFEPHVAERVFNDMLRSAHVAVYLNQWLVPTGVATTGARITSITTNAGSSFTAPMFVDASYEGDLLAAAGVSYTIGREATTTYGESIAGVRPSQVIMTMPAGVSPAYSSPPPGPTGTADARIQDSNYRLCFSSVIANQVPFARPSGYSATRYAIVVAYLKAHAAVTHLLPHLSWVLTVSPLANGKFDVNSAGPISLSLTGANWGWPDGDRATRASIAAEHASWDQGMLYFLRNDPSVPATVRSELSAYGLCKDEFTDNGHWPRLLYVREGRRMIGDYVLTLRDLTTQRSKVDIIGLASYRVDGHAVSSWVDASHRLVTEGSMSQPYRLYAIPYRSLTPMRNELTNLLAPTAISASHVAYASFRMEPQYMLSGEAAGEAAWLALPRGARHRATAVQDVSVPLLQQELRAHGSLLSNLGARD
jgi:hypothetical protein